MTAKGDEQAQLAIEMFCYRLKKYIGAYHAVLGRLDAIVFTGGIGENASAIRQRACQGLEHLGVAVDGVRNEAAGGEVAEIQDGKFPVRILVIRTNEEREVAEQTMTAVHKASGPQRATSSTR